MKQALGFPKSPFSLKPNYGSMNKHEFSKPEYTSKKNYSRLEGSPRAKTIMPETSGFKRSLLPTVRKYSQAIYPANKSSRESLNSSESNNSSSIAARRSPNPNGGVNHAKAESNASSASHQQSLSRMMSKQMNIGGGGSGNNGGGGGGMGLPLETKSLLYQQQQQSKHNYVSASLPPKPIDRTIKSSLSNENRYRIQFWSEILVYIANRIRMASSGTMPNLYFFRSFFTFLFIYVWWSQALVYRTLMFVC